MPLAIPSEALRLAPSAEIRRLRSKSNALEKLCLRDPATFAAYYGYDIIALTSEAWLGPAYQLTSQVNNVRPAVLICFTAAASL